MQRILPMLLVSVSVSLYPLAVYVGMDSVGPSVLLTGLLLLVGIRIGLMAANNIHRKITSAVLVTAATFVAFRDLGSVVALRFYPVVIGTVFFSIFVGSLLVGMPVIERIARMREHALPPAAVRYTRKLTAAWAALILLNTLIALYTALFSSFATWALYNGFLSYLVLGGFFAAEWLFRRRHIRHHT